MKRLVFISLAILIIVSCSRKVNYDNLSGQKVLAELDLKVYSNFNKSINEIINEFGEPESIDTTIVTNKHTDFKDNIYSLNYNEFNVEIYHSIEIEKYLLQSVEFNDDDFLNNLNINFGMTKEDCSFLSSQKVDEVDKDNHTEIVYSVKKEVGILSLVTFYFRNNSLYKLRYNAPIE